MEVRWKGKKNRNGSLKVPYSLIEMTIRHEEPREDIS